MELTKSQVDLLACPEGKREMLVFDSKLPGFGVRVYASGIKIFLVQYTRNGRTRRLKIGQMGVITPAEARRAALKLIGEIQSGGDPAGRLEKEREAEVTARAEAARAVEKRRREDEFTVSRLLDSWQSIKLKDSSASYRSEAPRVIRRVLGKLADAPACSITIADLQAVFDREIERAPAQTIAVRTAGRAAWGWAVKRGLVKHNPFATVMIETRVKARERVLTDAEIAEIWRSAGAKPYPFGPAIQLLMLTLQRRSEVMGMAWSELAPDFATWTIPAARAKNRRTHVVHLAPAAREILTGVKAHADRLAAAHKASSQAETDFQQSDFVFTTTGTSAASGVQKARRSLDPLAADEIEPEDARRAPAAGEKSGRARVRTDWRLHDFRRTGVSKMAELGIPPHVADRVLNHVSGAISGVAAVYQRFDFAPERKRALEVWAAYVLAVAQGKPSDSNVRNLPNILDRAKGSAA